MAMVCPRCRTFFEQRFSCPNCDVRLEYIDPRALRRRHHARFAMNWQHTPWGRTLVGLLIAQGLYYGLRHLLSSVLLRVAPEGATDPAGQLWIVVLLQTTQIISLILGGVIAGANQRQGVLQGAVLGVINGILSSVLHPANFPGPTTVVIYGTPLLQACFGALGAWVGYMIWTPLPEQPVPEAEGAQANKPKKASPPLFKGPVAWYRVGFGVIVGSVGYLSARMILEAVANSKLTSSLAPEDLWQEKLITWEIQALAVLAGALVAGSGRFNGLKQGLCVGVALSLLVVVYLGVKAAHAELVILTAVGCLVLSLAGGFFGSQLFPPVSAHGRTRGMGPAAAH